jgi:hypothetical protein
MAIGVFFSLTSDKIFAKVRNNIEEIISVK